jgi:large subunit ribosomal protein L22
MKASVRNIRISPKKLNVIAYIVRNMTAKDALDTLRFMPKKGANIIYDVIKSAVHNATHNDSQKTEDLKIASISVLKDLSTDESIQFLEVVHIVFSRELQSC